MWEIDGPHNRINHLINPDEEDSKKQAPVKKGLEELSQSLLELVEFLKQRLLQELQSRTTQREGEGISGVRPD